MHKLLTCALLLLPLGLQAAEAPKPVEPAAAKAPAPAASPSPETTTVAAKTPDAKPDTAKEAVKPEESFKPSVQISEDLSVSFPADI